MSRGRTRRWSAAGALAAAAAVALLLPARASAAPSDLAGPRLDDISVAEGSAPLLLQAVLPVAGPVAVQHAWDPYVFREQVLRLIPTDALGGIARTLVERKVEVRVDRDQAFLSLKIPIG